jgi:hypothetical protein
MKTFKTHSSRRRLAALGALALTTGLACQTVSAEPWKFGVMGDTQWTYAADAANSNSVAVSIINQLNPQFIDAGVKFVVQVGDLTDNGATAAITTTALARQALYHAGIGFYPLRGNHEGGQAAAVQFTNDFPQTQGLGTNVLGATGFNSPDPAGNGNLQGLSYAFDYANARFMLLDQFTRLGGTSPAQNDAIVDQLPWVDSVLASRAAGTHAFVFNHKNLIGQNHVDCMFGANPASNPTARNAFLGSVYQNRAGYVMSGHDHVHQRSLVTSPDGLAVARQLICASDSSKFYTPSVPSLDQQYNNPPRETTLSQDLYRVGYYIVTVDGPQVTVDYYASDEYFPTGNSPSTTPALHFQKRETFGYSLNGAEFLVAQGQTYTVVTNSIGAGAGFLGTSAAILGGSNGSTVVDGSARAVVKQVATGWAPATNTASDVLTLLGMTDLAANQTDAFALSMSYTGAGLTAEQLASGEFALCTRNAHGRWIRAVDANSGGAKTFIFGSYDASYGLGTYGVDTASGTVWAVVNHDGEFAAALTHIPQPGYIAGDWHQHSTYTDGSYTHAAVSASNAFFGLNWWAKSEHGGAFNRNGSVSGLDSGVTEYWDQMPSVTILGNASVSSGHTNMWRWQSIRDFEFRDTLAERITHSNKTIIQGLEWNAPGHEHCSMATIANEFGAGANAALVAQFEYQFDNSDSDTTGGAAQGWTKSPLSGHAKAIQAVSWLQTYLPTASWLTPAHPERYVYNGATGWNIEHFRDLNTAGPDVFFGFESMPGHQKAANRGEYASSRPSAGTNTYGGCGYFAATVGGLWDAMLGEGRKFWLFASSDFHATGGDFWPGEYQKTYSFVGDQKLADSHEAAQQIANSLRSGRAWVVEGDLIDALEFNAAGTVMGSKVFVTSNTVTVNITAHDPEGANFGPAGHNTPVLDHIDVIAGEFGGIIATNDPAYTNAANASTRVVARFDATGGTTDTAGITSTAWTDLGGGWKQMTMTFDTQGKSTYFRLRGSNHGLNVANETDGAGNPLTDALMGANDTTKAFDDLWFYSNPVFVQVNQSPTVTLDAPTNTASFTQGYTVSLTATATDDGDLAGVSFYANDALLGTDTSAPYAYNWTGAPLGTHQLKAVATDGFGLSATSAVAMITVAAPTNAPLTVTNVLRFRVNSSLDDVEELLSTGFMDFESSDLELIQDGSKLQMVGMRFNNVTIPTGVRILSAYVQFACDEIGGKNLNPFNVTVRGEAVDNATAFSSTASNLTTRTFTTASVPWSGAPDWQVVQEAGPAQRTPDLAPVVQEIVNRSGWAAGNSMVLAVSGQGGRCAEAWDGSPTEAPELVVIAVTDATFNVVDNNDDAEETLATGSMYLDSSDLELIQDGSAVQMVGVRFSNVSLPAGAELVDAYIQFTCDAINKNLNPFDVTIRAENSDNPVIYSTGLSNISSRPYTSSSVAWSGIPDWTIVGEAGRPQRTPSVVSLVNEVLARPGWQNGNAMAFTFVGSGTREAEARESGAATAPRLVLVYAGGNTLTLPPRPPALSITQSNGNMIVTWPAQGMDGYHLEFSPSLTGTNWVPVNGQGFFRLVK